MQKIVLRQQLKKNKLMTKPNSSNKKLKRVSRKLLPKESQKIEKAKKIEKIMLRQ